jgi:hypothetical protein
MHTCPHFLITFSAQTMKIVILAPFLGLKKGNLGQGLSWGWPVCLRFMSFHIQYPYHTVNAHLSPLFNHFSAQTMKIVILAPFSGPKKGEFGPGIVLMMINLLGIYAIPYTISIPPHKCIRVPTFYTFLGLNQWKLLFWPPFWAQKRDIWARDFPEDDQFAWYLCQSIYNIHTSP